MKESLYAVQADVNNREKQIKEATGEDIPMSEEKVKAVIDKWEVIENESSCLSPALQVCVSVIARTHSHTYTHSLTHTLTHTLMHIHTCTCTLTHTYMYMYTHTCTCIYSHTLAHIHSFTDVLGYLSKELQAIYTYIVHVCTVYTVLMIHFMYLYIQSVDTPCTC